MELSGLASLSSADKLFCGYGDSIRGRLKDIFSFDDMANGAEIWRVILQQASEGIRRSPVTIKRGNQQLPFHRSGRVFNNQVKNGVEKMEMGRGTIEEFRFCALCTGGGAEERIEQKLFSGAAGPEIWSSVVEIFRARIDGQI